MTSILIFGATGKTGLQIVTQALARGWSVRAVVRDAAKLVIRHVNLQVVVADMADPSAIESALLAAPVDAVVSALGVYSREPTTALSEGTRHIVEAVPPQRHLHRIVVVSTSSGAGDSPWSSCPCRP